MTSLILSETNNATDSAKRRLAALLSVRSKHSTYQELHPWVLEILGPSYSPSGKRETLRWEYMSALLDFHKKSVLDIGANTGYFSLASLAQGASEVQVFEGDRTHAQFIREVAVLLGVTSRLTVNNEYFDFDRNRFPRVDVTLCLNVLHHLGDDFGACGETLASVKFQIAEKLRQLAPQTHYCWLQLGFNWKGDRHQPLFENGRKAEIIDFVRSTCGSAWVIKDIALYDPTTGQYRPMCDALLRRFDTAGEFLNRPIFLLRSQAV